MFEVDEVTSQRCTPVSNEHPCLSISARNSLFEYPQNLPGGIAIHNDSVDTSFAFLRITTEFSNPACETGFRHLICLAASPPCSNSTDFLLPVCKESCSAFSRLSEEGVCDSVIRSTEKLLVSPDLVDEFTIFFSLISNFDCSKPSTYYFVDELHSFIDSESCTDMLTPQLTEATLSLPNQCAPAPTSSVCSSTFVSQYTHYIPLRSRNTTSYQQLLEEIVASGNFSENCTNIIVSLGCYITYPPCDSETGDALPLCTENCDTEFASIQSCVAEVTVSNELSNKIKTFSCPDINSYLPDFINVHSSQCIESLRLVNVLPGKVIAGAIVGAGLFLIGFILTLTALLFIQKRTNTLKHRRIRKMFSQKSGSIHYSTTNAGFNLTIDVQLSDADRRSYEKVFSSILVPYTALTVGEEIGQGAFGKVFRGEVKKPNSKLEDVAIKTIKDLSSTDEVKAFFAESLIMKDFSHPNILGLAGVCFDTPDGVPYILLPFMANGSLKDFLKSKRVNVTNVDTLPEDLTHSNLVRICLDVARGMEYLAEKKFVHRDLAARNSLVDSSLVVKVGDFGLARDVYSSDYYRAHQGARIPVKWMAPETLTDAISNEKTDVWSFGVTCWEVFSLGRGPYPGIQNQDILKHISTDNKRLDKPSLCSEALYSILMSQCWKLLPEERPTFSQLVHQLQDYWEEEYAYVIEDPPFPTV